MDIKDLKVGDKVRIVKCRYPTPGISFLGKTSFVEYIIEDINSARLSRWDVNINLIFLEKVDDDSTDIDMPLNEDTIFKPEMIFIEEVKINKENQ